MAQIKTFNPPRHIDISDGIQIQLHSLTPGAERKADVQAWNGQLIHGGTVTLSSEGSRKRFARAVSAAHPEVSQDQVLKALLHLYGVAPQLLAGDSAASEEAAPVDAEALWEKAKALAEAPDLIDRICAAVEYLGVVNERDNTILIYLAAVARLLGKPVNVFVKGVSSSGKSHLLGTVLRLLPDSAFMSFTGISPRYLVHSDKDLRHKIIVLYEAAGLSEGDGAYMMRSLLSEGRVQIGSLQKDANGSFEHIEVSKEGPTALFTSTTRLSLEPELETRALSLSTSDSPAQSLAINRATAQRYMGGAAPDVPLEDFQI